jgi:hypothetical protein
VLLKALSIIQYLAALVVTIIKMILVAIILMMKKNKFYLNMAEKQALEDFQLWIFKEKGQR